jgi:acyl-coenzyme A synthetase/AMP-(fatty) acid ligase
MSYSFIYLNSLPFYLLNKTKSNRKDWFLPTTAVLTVFGCHHVNVISSKTERISSNMFTADGYFFKGKPPDSLGRIGGIISQLPSLDAIVVVSYLSDRPDLGALGERALHWHDFTADTGENPAEIDFAQLPFSHPVYILYSSGTTGLPKCMV